MSDKEKQEAANREFAATWADGLGLEFAGLDLADLGTYSVLTILGRVFLSDPTPEAADGQ